MSFEFTRHGEARMHQRGFRKNDPDIIRQYGTLVDDEGTEVYIVTNKDVDRVIGELKQRIHMIERLRNCKVVINEGLVVTIMHMGHDHAKRLVRRRDQ